MKIKNENIGLIDPRIDEYINTLLRKAKDGELNNQSKNILNYVIYLLLNTDFQYILRSYRLGLCIPIDGFKNEAEINLWKIKYKETVTGYHVGKHVDPAVKFLIDEIEKRIRRPLIDKKVGKGELIIDICSNAISISASFIFSFLEFKNTKNVVYWLKIIYELLYFNAPEDIIRHLFKWSTVFGTQSLTFSKVDKETKMTIILYPDTTVKDIIQLIESKRKRIAEEIKKIKGGLRENEIEIDDIKRDYFIYKTYLGVKWDEKDQEKHVKRKDDRVQELAVDSLDEKDSLKIDSLTYSAIRQVVSRMKYRINKTVPKDKERLGRFLSPLNPS